MRFRDDIDLENTYVVSDTHFGHDNIVGFAHRPSDHESVMIERWARAVPESATVLHLGDLSYKSNSRFKALIAPHLTGARKLLILGNHDKQRPGFYKDCGFQVVRPFQIGVSRIGDPHTLYRADPDNFDGGQVPPQSEWFVSFDHYAYDGPIGAKHVRIHGHIHNNGYFRGGFVPLLRNHINISVEQTKYRPVNLANLLSGYLLGTQQVEDDDVQAGFDEESIQSILKQVERSKIR